MKKVNYSEFVERYFDCPYCSTCISDYENVCNGVIMEDKILICPECKKEIMVGKCV